MSQSLLVLCHGFAPCGNGREAQVTTMLCNIFVWRCLMITWFEKGKVSMIMIYSLLYLRVISKLWTSNILRVFHGLSPFSLLECPFLPWAIQGIWGARYSVSTKEFQHITKLRWWRTDWTCWRFLRWEIGMDHVTWFKKNRGERTSRTTGYFWCEQVLVPEWIDRPHSNHWFVAIQVVWINSSSNLV